MTSNETRFFEYQPLDRSRSEIRLVCLRPSPNKSSPLLCELQHVSLDENPNYEALSYTWGTQTRTHSITVDGSDFPVTVNLYFALWTLRQEHEDYYIWIDAVCINQKDVEERNYEVLRMLHIYKQASKAVVWLGEESEDSPLAIAHLQHLSALRKVSMNIDMSRSAVVSQFMSVIRVQLICITAASIAYVLRRPFFIAWAVGLFAAVRYWNMPSRGISYYTLYTAKLWTKLDLIWGILNSWWAIFCSFTTKPAPSPAIIIALEGFFSRPWFRRVWIIQEIGAAREATIVCGRQRISWTEVCEACKQIHVLISSSSSRSPYLDTYFQRADNIRNSLNTSNISTRKARYKRSLIFLLDRFGHFEATNPRDKIYGLLGLAEDMVTVGDRGPLLTPDYSKSVVTVYSELARFMISETCSLDFLSFTAGLKRLPGLPSWAPDWTYTAYRGGSWADQGRRKTHQLPDNQDVIATFSEDLTTLTVQGFIVGYLPDEGRVLFTSRQAWKSHQNFYFTILNFIMRYFIRPFGSIIYKSGVLPVLGRVIVNLLLKIGPRKRLHYALFLEFLAESLQTAIDESNEDGCGNADHVEVGLSSMENLLGAMHDRDREESESRQIDLVPSHDDIFLLSSRETDGHGVQRGDLFCMIAGASYPLILRKQLDGYELIGTTPYNTFDPLIWKTCMSLWNEGSLELMEFVLR